MLVRGGLQDVSGQIKGKTRIPISHTASHSVVDNGQNISYFIIIIHVLHHLSSGDQTGLSGNLWSIKKHHIGTVLVS